MNAFDCVRPACLDEALAQAGLGGNWLAGGQSLVAAIKLGMASPSLLIDLQDVPGLRDIRLETAPDGSPALWIGAMATHASVAGSELVRASAPGIAALAGGIADAQVRQMGTIGGSLAHNDPAACWPAGVLALGATVVTSRRELPAEQYFQGLYSTALEPGELIVGVRFPRLAGLKYLKFEQNASRFALVGVAVADLGAQGMRVAVTGLGLGVVRWPEAEQALAARRSVQALAGLRADGLQAVGDLHASAAYRRHLCGVLTGRCVAALTGESVPIASPLTARAAGSQDAAAPQDPADGFGSVETLQAPPAQVWRTLLDPRQLQASIPGCESLVQHSQEAYEATVKVGLGPLSVRFKSQVQLRDLRPPESLTLVFHGQAGALGSGQGTARVRLEALADGGTRLHWWVQVQLGGRLAQFGNRLVEATARQLSGQFFERTAAALRAPAGSMPPASQPLPWWRRLLQLLLTSPRK